MEEFFTSYQHTLSALSAVATFLAVWVALYIANRQSSVELSVYADTGKHIPEGHQSKVDLSKCEDVIMVSLTNVGNVPCFISYFSFCWTFPRWVPNAKAAQQNPYKPVFPQKPIEIKPKESATIFLTNDFVALKKVVQKLCENRFFRRFVKLEIRTCDGQRFYVRFGKQLKNILKSQCS
jgi:hypothetical protein